MAMNKAVLKPHGALRSPTADVQDNGKLVNPPIYPNFGGAKQTERLVRNNNMPIKHVGDK